MLEHEYALIGGMNRAKIGRYLSLIAATVSGCLVFLLLKAVDLARYLGVSVNLPPTILSLVAAGSIFTVLYWLFDKRLWRWPPLNRWLNVPDLSGQWSVKGQTLDRDCRPTFDWQGTITIIQHWDRLRVRLKTENSGSNSVAAALVCDAADGYRLLYDYRNEPNIDQPDLKSHRGFAELTFDKNGRTAKGEYFNGHGRFTFGTMELKRA